MKIKCYIKFKPCTRGPCTKEIFNILWLQVHNYWGLKEDYSYPSFFSSKRWFSEENFSFPKVPLHFFPLFHPSNSVLYVPGNFGSRTCVSIIEICYHNTSSLAEAVTFTLEPFVEFWEKNFFIENKQKILFVFFQSHKGTHLLFI